MLTSELISELQKQLQEFGDKPVAIDCKSSGLRRNITVDGGSKRLFLFLSDYKMDCDGNIIDLN